MRRNYNISLQRKSQTQKKTVREIKDKKAVRRQKTSNKMTMVSPSGSISLNVNGLHSSIKKHRLSGLNKQDPIIYFIQETHFIFIG